MGSQLHASPSFQATGLSVLGSKHTDVRLMNADPFLLCLRPFPSLGKTSSLLKCPGSGVNTPTWPLCQPLAG